MPTAGASSSNRVESLALYRRAANYIAVAMIYLQDNHLLKEPLKPEHIKHRLLGHWGTVPGLNLMYAGLNRLILDTSASILLVTGPGHGAPANLANLWIDGCLEDVRPELSRDDEGLGRLVRSFSWPGGFPSHLAPIVPGTIHEGGELGYALATAFGAAFDNPELIVGCIVGDGEAETGPTAGAWHSNKFLDPATCGAVLPMLHLNGYKIANPTIYKSMSDEELTKLFEGYGWRPLIVQGEEDLDAEMAKALDTAYADIRELQEASRGSNRPERPRWPMLVRAHPSRAGPVRRRWTGSRSRAPPRPIRSPRCRRRPTPSISRSSRSGCAPTARRSCSTTTAAPVAEIVAACPEGDLRMGANPHVNGGKLRKPLALPELKDHATPRLERRAPTTAVP